MLTIFNRTELITTMDMQRQANIRSVLSANGIAYTVRTENLQGSSAFGGRSRGSSGSFGTISSMRLRAASSISAQYCLTYTQLSRGMPFLLFYSAVPFFGTKKDFISALSSSSSLIFLSTPPA